jgi:hypothetical protein
MALTVLPITFNTVLKPSVKRSTPATKATPSNGKPAADNTVVMVINALPGTPGVLKETIDILAAVKRTAIPHHATFLGWSRQWG